MKLIARTLSAILVLVASSSVLAQSQGTTPVGFSTEVPRMIRFSGVAKDESGKPLTGTLGVTFLLYKDQEGGSPLWMETQNVHADSTGHYTTMLGAASRDGVPLALFSSAEVHWVSTQVSGQQEQARVALLSVPYALKAADAETLGGLPVSAFVQTNANSEARPSGTVLPKAKTALPPDSSITSGSPPATAVTGTGTTNFLPLWTSSSNIGNSILFQTGGNVGVGNKTPGAKLDTTGTSIAVRGSSSGATGTGVFGRVTNGSGINFGVQGTTPSTAKGSAGVQGISSAATGYSAGILGTSASPNAPGVLAHANGLNATGVLGQALSTTTGQTVDPALIDSTSVPVPQMGVEGVASSSQGVGAVGISQQFGVLGKARGSGRNAAGYYPAGVLGYAADSTDVAYGVQGLTMSPTTYAAGVFGNAAASSGLISGVAGVTGSSTDHASGVSGYASATSGQVFGVNGVTNSSTTYSAGVAGGATSSSGLVFGVNGAVNSTTGGAAGVNGYEGATSGQVYGVSGATTSSDGAGVQGIALATSGNTIGVLGVSTSPEGTAGLFQNNSTGAGAKILVAKDSSGTQRLSVDNQGNVNVVIGTSTQVSAPLLPVNHARTALNITDTSHNYFITLNWSFTFPDLNYTVTCSILDPTNSSQPGISSIDVNSISTTTVSVQVAPRRAQTVTINCLGVHD